MMVIAAGMMAAACGSPAEPHDVDAAPPVRVCGVGETQACTDLAGSYGGGTATCRADGSGWDVSACTAANGTRFEVVQPATRDPRWADARCNDGTPFAAFVRINPASHVWVIDLEGGVFCDDHALSCAQRVIDSPELTTTLPGGDRMIVAGPDRGVLSRDAQLNPDFAGANHVLAHYCSSDFWAGATTERRPTSGDAQDGWYFSGRANVAALLAILKERYGLDDARDDLRVLWMGTSAGAHGAHFNVAAIQATLPSAVAAGRVKLFADAGWMFDWDQPTARIINTDVADREVWRSALAFWGGHLDAACEAAHADPMDCWFGIGWYPQVKTVVPVFVQQSRRDGSFGAFLHPGVDYAVWQPAAEASLAGVDWLWSGASIYHVLSGSDAGWHTGTSPNTLREAVGRFWAGGPPERILF